jgi:hypothetical protein
MIYCENIKVYIKIYIQTSLQSDCSRIGDTDCACGFMADDKLFRSSIYDMTFRALCSISI